MRPEQDGVPKTFSPESRFFKVDYAIEVIKLGSTAIDIQVAEGYVVLLRAFHSSSLVHLIAAVATSQPHVTHIVI